MICLNAFYKPYTFIKCLHSHPPGMKNAIYHFPFPIFPWLIFVSPFASHAIRLGDMDVGPQNQTIDLSDPNRNN